MLFTFPAFIIFTIDELAKLYFDKVKCIQELTHLDNSKKDINLDKILQDSTYFYFQEIFISTKLFFISNQTQNYYK